MSLVELVLAELGRVHEYYQREHGATNLGSTPGKPGTVWWMRKKSDRRLYVIQEDGAPAMVNREEWEALTDFDPPWPWNDLGSEMEIPS